MEERRGYSRGYPVGSGFIYVQSSPKGMRFSLNDISALGIQLVTQFELAVGIEINIRVDLPLGMFYRRSFLVKGVILRKEKVNYDFCYSIQFLDLEASMSIEIDEIVQYLNRHQY